MLTNRERDSRPWPAPWCSRPMGVGGARPRSARRGSSSWAAAAVEIGVRWWCSPWYSRAGGRPGGRVPGRWVGAGSERMPEEPRVGVRSPIARPEQRLKRRNCEGGVLGRGATVPTSNNVRVREPRQSARLGTLSLGLGEAGSPGCSGRAARCMDSGHSGQGRPPGVAGGRAGEGGHLLRRGHRTWSGETFREEIEPSTEI